MRKYPLYETEHIRDLKELTDGSVRRYSDSDAFKVLTGASDYTTVTYGQFGDNLCALANSLINLGFSGRRIALIGENSYDWVLSYFAIVNSNITVVPLDKELTNEEILSFIERTGAAAFLYSNTFKEEAAYVAERIPGIFLVSFEDGGGAKQTLGQLIEQGRELVKKGNDRYSDIEIDRERECSILFTSGTTGLSKGVMLTHSSLAANIVSASELVLYKPDDVLLSILPIHHCFEAMAGILIPIFHGSTIAFCPGIKQLPSCFELFRPTFMILVPLYLETFHRRIWDTAKKHGKDGKLKIGIFLASFLGMLGIDVKDKLFHEVHASFGGRLKLVISGGAHLDPELVKAYRQLGIKILQGYGTSECSPVVSVNRNLYYKDKSVGCVLSCNSVRTDENGEILVKGENLMKGYLDNEKATAEAFDGDWYKTGDLGFLDKDGFLYVTGRCKDLIVLKNGKNVMPEEIEGLLVKSPLIAEAMVKESPGDANGSDSIMAIIYPDPEAVKGIDKVNLKETIQNEVDKVNQKLVYYKKVHSIILREKEFPKTSKKSIMRFKVNEEGFADV